MRLAPRRAPLARGSFMVGFARPLYPDEAREMGGGHAVVSGDGEHVWPFVLAACVAGDPAPHYDGGRIDGDRVHARALGPAAAGALHVGVGPVRGCPKHCSFCSVWRTDGQKPRQRRVQRVLDEIVDLRRRGFRFIALADDNFYPVTLEDLRMADRRSDKSNLEQLQATRAERFELMAALEKLPDDTVFFTQITMEAAEDPEFLDAMRRARIKGALVGVESVTPEGLKDVYKELQRKRRGPRRRVCSSSRSTACTCSGRSSSACPAIVPRPSMPVSRWPERSRCSTFAQFVMLTPFPGTLDFQAWEKSIGPRSSACRRHPGDAPLADPAGTAAEGVR